MNPGDFVVWTFIVIFIATAIITLGGLIGKVRVEPYYKKKLFYMLLAEVIGVVVFIAKTAVQPPTADLRTMLLGARNGRIQGIALRPASVKEWFAPRLRTTFSTY